MYARPIQNRSRLEYYGEPVERLDENTCCWDDPGPFRSPSGSKSRARARLACSTGRSAPVNHYGFEERFSPYPIRKEPLLFPRSSNVNRRLDLPKPPEVYQPSWDFPYTDYHDDDTPAIEMFDPESYKMDRQPINYLPPAKNGGGMVEWGSESRMPQQQMKRLPQMLQSTNANRPTSVKQVQKRREFPQNNQMKLGLLSEPQKINQQLTTKSTNGKIKKAVPVLPKVEIKREPTSPDRMDRLVRPLRILTVTPTSLKSWAGLCLQFNVIYELFGLLSSSVSRNAEQAKQFYLKSQNDAISCLYYEIDRPLPVLPPNQWIRCVGSLDKKFKSLHCVSVRPAKETETKYLDVLVKKTNELITTANRY